MKKLFCTSYILFCILTGCGKEVVPSQDKPSDESEVCPVLIPEVRSTLDSVAKAGDAYITLHFNEKVIPGKYQINLKRSSDNFYYRHREKGDRYSRFREDWNNYDYFSNGDSLDIQENSDLLLKASYVGDVPPGTYDLDITLSSLLDTLSTSITYEYSPVYNFTLERLLNTNYTKRYSVLPGWEKFDTEDYFGLVLPQDGSALIGMHMKDIIFPDVYGNGNYFNENQGFLIPSTEHLNSQTAYMSFSYQERFDLSTDYVTAKKVNPVKPGQGTLTIEKGPYKYHKDYQVYEPVVLDIEVQNNYFLSATIYTVGISSGIIKLKCTTEIQILRESDGLLLWGGKVTENTFPLTIKAGGAIVHSKIVDFTEEYYLCKNKLYETGGDKAILSFYFTAEAPFENAIFKGYSIRGIATRGSEFKLNFERTKLMEVSYE